MQQLNKLLPTLLTIGLLNSLIMSNSCSSSKHIPIITVCFTPGGACNQLVEAVVKQAKYAISVQAYVFTSKIIAKALVEASKRNVIVNVIVEQSQMAVKGSQVAYLINQGIPVWIDTVPGLAHNKVMIIDNQYVLTGSFNWTHAAQNYNAENLILINDQQTNQIYQDNWNKRLQQAKEITIADIQ